MVQVNFMQTSYRRNDSERKTVHFFPNLKNLKSSGLQVDKQFYND